MELLEQIRQLVNMPDISDDYLLAIVCEMGRYYDKQFVNNLQKLQIQTNKVYDTPTRKRLRKKFYYGHLVNNFNDEDNISLCNYSNLTEISIYLKDFICRLKTYPIERIALSIIQKQQDLQTQTISDNLGEQWLKNYYIRHNDKKYSFVVFKLTQDIFIQFDYNQNILFDFIYSTYADLENYRHMAIIVDGEIYSKNQENITWQLLYKASIYAENFIQFTDKFTPFNAAQQIKTLNEFLQARNINNNQLALDFYSAISTGYQFEDCYISDDQYTKILIFQKIALDNSNVPCPSCNTIIQNGNSYPKMFLKSWECKNPQCPDRSKSGRGKRFDEYGVYRYYKLVENDFNNQIDNQFYSNWRRDIFKSQLDYRDLLIKQYTYADEAILSYNIIWDAIYARKNVMYTYKELDTCSCAIKNYEDLPLIKLFTNINNLCNNQINNDASIKLSKDIEIYNANSTNLLAQIIPNQITSVITSPPYYNAREYSQWSNLIVYLIDMLLNAKSVFNIIKENSFYLYNIGDIVGEDNIYINSKMSHRRLPLGFLSCMIFEIIGYHLVGNKIWDKGEVQSRRNSTVNLFTGYIKCINCYEHILVFKKGQEINNNINTVETITPVIKINNKGQNTYGHTAPYPIELVNLIKPFINEDGYILDPYLGSGTTLKWCKQNGYKGIGIELNKDYYNLCLENIKGQD